MKKTISFILTLAMIFTFMSLPVRAEEKNYPYTVNSLTAKAADGTIYSAPPSDRSFITELEVEKVGARDSSDYFIVAIYGTDGSLIGLNYAYANIGVGQKIAYGINIPKTNKAIGEIRAFIWDSLSGMKPLSETAKTVCAGVSPGETGSPAGKPTASPAAQENVYKVLGQVTGTFKSGDAAQKDEIRFTITKSENWLGNKISPALDNSEDISLYIGDTDIDEHIKEYVEVYIEETPNYDYRAVSYKTSTEKQELNADDFDWENPNYSDTSYTDCGRLYFYDSDTGMTTNYKIDENVELYVNGVKYDDVNTGIDSYIKKNKTSKVTLFDTPSDDSYSTDGYYDLIKVDCYGTLVIDEIYDLTAPNPLICGLADDMGIGSWELNLDTEDVAYSFKKDGAKISVSDLKPYDVLSINYDVTGYFEDSSFYEVIVSDAQEKGRWSTYDDNDEYEINGKKYGYNANLIGDMPLDSDTIYILYLDAFGQIVWAEEDVTSKKIAILDSVYYVYGGESYEAKLIFPDGTSDTYELRDALNNITDAKRIVYKDGESGDKNNIQDRVIEYAINDTTKELTIRNIYTPTAAGGSMPDGEYRVNNGKLGFAKISLDTTRFVNASDLTNIRAMSPSMLVDGAEYKAYAFDKSPKDGTYSFVIILSSVGDYTVKTKMAVYNKTLNQENESGDLVDVYELFINGEKKTVNWESGLEPEDLTQGDAILYQTNSSGEITGVTKLLNADMTDTDTIWNKAFSSSDAMIAEAKTFVQGFSTWRFDADLQFGAVLDKSALSLLVSPVSNNMTSENEGNDISFEDGCSFYSIDYNKNIQNRISAVSAEDLEKTTILPGAYTDDEYSQINWTKNAAGKPILALAKTVNGKASDIIVIIPKKSGADSVAVMASTAFDYDNPGYTGNDYLAAGELYFRNDGKVTSYKLSDAPELYVNGEKYDSFNEGVELFVKDSVDSLITLTDIGSDGAYDKIEIKYYAPKQFAVLNSVYDTNGGADYEAQLILPDGSKKAYILDGETTNIEKALSITYTDGNSGEKNPVQNRVITYSVSSSTNKLTVNSSEKGRAIGTNAMGNYNMAAQKLGNTKISPENTSLISAANSSKIMSMPINNLVDNADYIAYAYDRSYSDGIYKFVILLSGTGDYTATTKMAVYNQTLSQKNEYDDTVDAYELFVDGERKTVNWEVGLTAEALTQGDAILYQTNASGEITDVKRLLDADMTNTDTVWDNALTDSAAMIAEAKTFVQGLSTVKFDADLQFGVIVNKTSGSMALAEAKDSVTNEDEAIDISYDPDCDFYVIDYNKNASERIAVSTSSSIIRTSAVSSAYLNDDNTLIDWSKNTLKPRLALVKTIDKDATDVYVIIPKR